MTVIDKILQEWAYRCSDGVVDLNDPSKVAVLEEILTEFGVEEKLSPRSAKYFQQKKAGETEPEQTVAFDQLLESKNLSKRTKELDDGKFISRIQ